MMIKKIILNKFSFFIFLILFAIYITFGLTVNNQITAEDQLEIKKLKLDEVCINLNSFIDEIKCINTVRHKILISATNEGCNKGKSVEPKDLIERGYGCCVEFSRFIEKALRSYKFKTRHVFIIEPYKNKSFLNFIPLKQQSHAASEVLTSLGWIAVDSKYEIISYKKNDNVYEIYDFKNLIENKEIVKEMGINFYKKRKLDIIYGLYSRHGQFYGPNLPGPEFNWREILYNL